MVSKNENLSTLASNIKQGIDARLKDLHTSMPAIIESFDAATQIATVQPAIKRIFKTDDGEIELLTPSPLPILINVPVQFPRGGGFSLTFPVAKGDECLLVFAERSIDIWHKSGGVQNPGAKRFHSLSDATAFVGISSLVNKVPNYDPTNVQLKKDDDSVYLTLKANGNLDAHADGDINATCDNANITADTKATVTAPDIELIGAVQITGTLDVSGVSTFAANIIAQADVAVTGILSQGGTDVGKNHAHPQGNDSGGATEQDTGGVL